MSNPDTPEKPQVEVFYSLQSNYCYFLLDRLIALEKQGVAVIIRPIQGALLRLPDRYRDRDVLEQRYFATDTERTATYLGLPYAEPDPFPIDLKEGPYWIAEGEQPLNEYIHRLYVGAHLAQKSLAFLDSVGRMLWDGSTPQWHEGGALAEKLNGIGLNLPDLLERTSWTIAQAVLSKNAEAILAAGHWGVPLMVLEGEPFYGQDRFDQLLWRMGEKGYPVHGHGPMSPPPSVRRE